MPPAKSAKIEIGAIGTINRDTIYQPDGGKVESWGGLLYSLKWVGDNDSVTVIPVVNVGRDSYRQVMEIVGNLKNVDPSHIEKVEEKNNHCFLHYHNQSHKCEILKGSVPPLTYSRVRPLRSCDLILVNFISGPDIKLAALEKLRRNYSGLIYIDIHSLTLGRRKVPDGFRRFLRRPRYWRRYVACADILQLNEGEFGLLSGREFSNKAARDFFILETDSLTCLVITRGLNGTHLVYIREEKIVSRNVKPDPVQRVYDTTGCGDIFGAGFIVEYLKSGSLIKAARNGNRLAAERCRIKGNIF